MRGEFFAFVLALALTVGFVAYILHPVNKQDAVPALLS